MVGDSAHVYFICLLAIAFVDFRWNVLVRKVVQRPKFVFSMVWLWNLCRFYVRFYGNWILINNQALIEDSDYNSLFVGGHWVLGRVHSSNAKFSIVVNMEKVFQWKR